jgi:hypothetical protein
VRVSRTSFYRVFELQNGSFRIVINVIFGTATIGTYDSWENGLRFGVSSKTGFDKPRSVVNHYSVCRLKIMYGRIFLISLAASNFEDELEAQL